MKIKLWSVTFDTSDGNKTEIHTTAEAAHKSAADAVREWMAGKSWETRKVTPDNWREVLDDDIEGGGMNFIYFDEHEIEIDDSKPSLASTSERQIIDQLARMTTPTDGVTDADKADDIMADLDDATLCGDATTLYDMIRKAREIVAKPCVASTSESGARIDDIEDRIAQAVKAGDRVEWKAILTETRTEDLIRLAGRGGKVQDFQSLAYAEIRNREGAAP